MLFRSVLFFGIIALMLYLNLEIAFGAFVAGTFIATFFDHKKDLPHKLASFGFGFLVPTFFVHIGSTFKLSAFMIDGVVRDAALITGVMIGFRLAAGTVFLNILGLKNTVLFALSHSMPLTLKLRQRCFGPVLLMVPVAALHGHVGLIDRHDHPLRLDVFQHHRLQQAKSRAHVARAAIKQHQRQVHELPGLAFHGDFTLEFVDDVFGVLQISRSLDRKSVV